MNDRSLIIERRFDVAPDVVFDAFTIPDAMRVWWTDDTEFDIDLRPGGRWSISREEDGAKLTMTGEYLELDRPHRLRQTIGMPEFSPNFDVVTIDIAADADGGCTVRFEQIGPEIAAELAAHDGESPLESEEGWQQGFDLMEAAWRAR